MNYDEALAAIKAVQNSGDIEYSHTRADQALCEFLTHLGYTALVEEFEKVEKWYS